MWGPAVREPRMEEMSRNRLAMWQRGGKEKNPMRRAWEAVRFWKKKEVPRVSPKWGHQREKVLMKAEGEPEDSMGAWGRQESWHSGEMGQR